MVGLTEFLIGVLIALTIISLLLKARRMIWKKY